MPGLDILVDLGADALRIPIDYVLEARYQGTIRVAMSLPWHPRSIISRTPSHATVVHLLNGDKIREHGRIKHRTFKLEGNSGLKPRSGYDRYGNIILASGPELFREFEKFLDDYQFAAEKFPGQWELIFRAFEEDIHWLVEPGEFVWNRSADRSRFTYDWSLELNGYEYARREVPTNIFSPLAENFTSVTDKIREVGNYAAEAETRLTNIRNDLDVFREPVRAVGTVVTGLDNLVESWREFLSFPIDALGDLTNLTRSLKQSYTNLITSPDVLVDGLPVATERLLVELGVSFEDSDKVATEALGRAGGTRNTVARAQQRLQVPDADSVRVRYVSPTVSTEEFRVRAGQDLRDVAREALQDEDRWVEVAQINGLVSVDKYSDGTPLLPGDILRIPADEDTNGNLLDTSTFRDLAIDASGDLSFNILDPNQSAVQVASIRAGTIRGDSVWPDLGIPNVVGLKLTQRLIGLVSAEVTAALEQDPRVSGVVGLEVIDSDDTLIVTGEVVLRGQNRIPFEIAIG